jgi:glutathione S-transferase
MGWNQSSALVLDDGTAITESITICRYFEAVKPDPPLFGRCALEVARIEMWKERFYNTATRVALNTAKSESIG